MLNFNLTDVVTCFYKTPLYIILFVSNTCWTNCKHCWVGESKKKGIGTGSELTLNELEILSNSLKTIAFLSLTGGEAFGRDDIVEIISMFNRNCNLKRFQIPTSGFQTELIIERTERILKENSNCPFRVDVSLDGNKEIHDYIRGVPGSFENAVKTITELNNLGRKYKNLDIGIITTISSYNENNIEEISEIVKNLNPDREWMVNIIRGDIRDPAARNSNMVAYNKAHEVINMRQKINKNYGHAGHFTAKWLSAKNAVRRTVINKIVTGDFQRGTCSAGRIAGVIYNDGSVFPCEMINNSLGNLRDYNFDLERLWNSKEAKKITKCIEEIKCTCTQECFLSVNLMLQFRWWPQIIWKRLKMINWPL